MKKVPSNATKKLAAIRALTANFPAVAHGTDMSDMATHTLSTAATAWEALDARPSWYGVFDAEDGSYRIGSSAYSPLYTIAPADHEEIARVHRENARRAEWAQQVAEQRHRIEATGDGMAIIRGEDGKRYKITTEAAGGIGMIGRMESGQLLPLQVLKTAREELAQDRSRTVSAFTTRGAGWFTVEEVAEVQHFAQQESPALLEASSITIEWSEADEFADGQVFSGPTCWAEVNRRAELVKAQPFGYYFKTSFKVTWPDGETYSGRWDICRNDHDGATLEAHILEHVAFYAGLWVPEHMTAERAADEVARVGKAAEHAEWLEAYRVGAAPRRAAPVQVEAQPVKAEAVQTWRGRREGYVMPAAPVVPVVKPRVRVWSDGSQMGEAPTVARVLN